MGGIDVIVGGFYTLSLSYTLAHSLSHKHSQTIAQHTLQKRLLRRLMIVWRWRVDFGGRIVGGVGGDEREAAVEFPRSVYGQRVPCKSRFQRQFRTMVGYFYNVMHCIVECV